MSPLFLSLIHLFSVSIETGSAQRGSPGLARCPLALWSLGSASAGTLRASHSTCPSRASEKGHRVQSGQASNFQTVPEPGAHRAPRPGLPRHRLRPGGFPLALRVLATGPSRPLPSPPAGPGSRRAAATDLCPVAEPRLRPARASRTRLPPVGSAAPKRGDPDPLLCVCHPRLATLRSLPARRWALLPRHLTPGDALRSSPAARRPQPGTGVGSEGQRLPQPPRLRSAPRPRRARRPRPCAGPRDPAVRASTPSLSSLGPTGGAAPSSGLPVPTPRPRGAVNNLLRFLRLSRSRGRMNAWLVVPAPTGPGHRPRADPAVGCNCACTRGRSVLASACRSAACIHGDVGVKTPSQDACPRWSSLQTPIIPGPHSTQVL